MSEESVEMDNYDLRVKVKELEAQLARCVGSISVAIDMGNAVKNEYPKWPMVVLTTNELKALLDSLPKTSHLDAEILKCAFEVASWDWFDMVNSEYDLSAYEDLVRLDKAVLAKRGASDG